MKKFLFIAIKIGFIVGLFVYLFRPETFGQPEDTFKDISFAKLAEILQSLDFSTALFWFSFAAIVKLAGICCGVMRWNLLLKGQGISLPFWYLTKCWFTGRAIGLVLPGTVGLDGYRLVESSVYTGEVIKCTTVIAVEKLIGIVALGLLVFLTLPLGARLFDFNITLLAVILLILFSFILVAFLMLLNPRIVQVLVAVIPTPKVIRTKVNKLGIAVTAYSGHRLMLMFAVLLGLGVHLGICLMYFGVAMAISGGESSFLDLMFASPFVIVGSIIAPTVSGLGVREGMMTILLGAKYGTADAFLFGHLGLWLGEAIPFLLSVPLIVLAGRPDREEFLSELAKVRSAAGEQEEVDLNLQPAEIENYRNKLIDCIGAGSIAGLIGGALCGLAEGGWHLYTLAGSAENSALWWAPLVYGIVLCGLGVGISALLIFGYLLVDKFVPAAVTFGLSLGGTMGIVFLIFGRFRYQRDILNEQPFSLVDYAIVLGGVIVVVGLAVFIGSILAGWVKNSRLRGLGVGIAVYGGIVLTGFVLSLVVKTDVEPAVFEALDGVSGPNVVLIAVDTLRADYLQAFNASAHPKTPNISKLADDGIVFQNTIAQSSWTKASFGTIFSGLYPETHTATGKSSGLPDEVTTIAEVLRDAGYYTQGFSNNPNITGLFNYDQGFVQYTDLKPSLIFGAQPSSEKLVLYDILRKIVQKVNARLGGRISITDFYQPGDSVTNTGLAWVDGASRPASSPFFLFMHYMDPHDPFRDPERPGKGYARVQIGNPKTDELKEDFIRSYTYEIEFMDEQLGRFLEGLKERGLYDDALIVFTSDHGEEFFEHGGWWHGLSLYEEQIAVPLLIKLPNSEVTDVNMDLARHVDIAPTVATLAGVGVSEQWQGRTLLTESLNFNNAETSQVHSHLNFEGIELHALRTLSRKLITANEGNKRNLAPVEFYNLDLDPHEQDNLAAQSETEVSAFLETLSSMNAYILEDAAEPASIVMDALSDAERERLESLGYLNTGGAAPEVDEPEEEPVEVELPF